MEYGKNRLGCSKNACDFMVQQIDPGITEDDELTES